jgi:hypothetical protein
VSLYTVSRELGHGSKEMVRQVYAHLGDFRHRSEVVGYRLEQHLKPLGDRLQRLGLSGPSVYRERYCRGAALRNDFPRRARSHSGGRSSRERATGLEPATSSLGSD